MPHLPTPGRCGAPGTRHPARLLAAKEKLGRKIPAPDAYLAAIAMVRGFAVATRDVEHFRGTGLAVINPWE